MHDLSFFSFFFVFDWSELEGTGDHGAGDGYTIDAVLQVLTWPDRADMTCVSSIEAVNVAEMKSHNLKRLMGTWSHSHELKVDGDPNILLAKCVHHAVPKGALLP
ncbi:hypothetical protein V6N12_002642 [Hibiscus sabdariffa]|uniref:Uncharacterized protein n=1 Tax=Hibiscus sabdariffa TaxID=183260 RepID=A0ABR2E9K3_9ROSI